MKDGDSFPLSPDEVRIIESRRATAAMSTESSTITVEQRKSITTHILGLIHSLTQLAGKVDAANGTIHEIAHILARDDR